MGRGLSKPRSTLEGKRKRLVSKDARSQSRSASRGRSASTAGGEYGSVMDNFIELPDETIAYAEVAEKYKLAASIANEVLRTVCDGCVEGASALELCKQGDELMAVKANQHYTKPDENGDYMDRGIAFPTCVNANNIACHFHPIRETDDVRLKRGDVVRVELGVHIDGYISSAAHTLIVGFGEDTVPEIEDQIHIDVLAATYTAAAAALRLMKPGGCNHDITEMFRSVSHSYGVSPAQGVLSHRMKRWDEAGQQIILGCKRLEDNMCQETVIFRPGQVWSLDVVLMNGGDNKLRPKANSPSDHFIFKRSEVLLGQRLRSARYVLSALRDQGNPSMLPFTVETFDKPVKAQFGMAQLVKSQLVDAVPVLYCKPHQCVGRYKWTVLITDKGVQRIAGLPPPPYVPVVTDRVTRDVAALLCASVKVEAEVPRIEEGPGKRQKTAPQRLKDATAPPTEKEEEGGPA
eukprot:EG_transcript_11784